MILLGGSEFPQNLPIWSDDLDPPSWIVSKSLLEFQKKGQLDKFKIS